MNNKDYIIVIIIGVEVIKKHNTTSH